MDKRILGIGALVVLAMIALLVWFQWGAHVELTGQLRDVRVQGVTPTDSIMVVDCALTNPATVPFEVDDIDALVQPAQGDPVTGAPVAVMDVPRLIEAYPALRGLSDPPSLKSRDVIKPGETVRRRLMFQFAGLSEAQLKTRKSLTVNIHERLGAVGVLKESR